MLCKNRDLIQKQWNTSMCVARNMDTPETFVHKIHTLNKDASTHFTQNWVRKNCGNEVKFATALKIVSTTVSEIVSNIN